MPRIDTVPASGVGRRCRGTTAEAIAEVRLGAEGISRGIPDSPLITLLWMSLVSLAMPNGAAPISDPSLKITDYASAHRNLRAGRWPEGQWSQALRARQLGLEDAQCLSLEHEPDEGHPLQRWSPQGMSASDKRSPGPPASRPMAAQASGPVPGKSLQVRRWTRVTARNLHTATRVPPLGSWPARECPATCDPQPATRDEKLCIHPRLILLTLIPPRPPTTPIRRSAPSSSQRKEQNALPRQAQRARRAVLLRQVLPPRGKWPCE